jgi:hypothetical protein
MNLDRRGWGPGGRRFKSCLPDVTKALLMRGVRRLWMAFETGDGSQRREALGQRDEVGAPSLMPASKRERHG